MRLRIRAEGDAYSHSVLLSATAIPVAYLMVRKLVGAVVARCGGIALVDWSEMVVLATCGCPILLVRHVCLAGMCILVFIVSTRLMYPVGNHASAILLPGLEIGSLQRRPALVAVPSMPLPTGVRFPFPSPPPPVAAVHLLSTSISSLIDRERSQALPVRSLQPAPPPTQPTPPLSPTDSASPLPLSPPQRTASSSTAYHPRWRTGVVVEQEVLAPRLPAKLGWLALARACAASRAPLRVHRCP